MVNPVTPAEDRNLTKKSFKAAGLGLVLQFANQFVRLLIGIGMLRLLTPQDYGVIGMLSLFWGISAVFINGGFGQAIIQRKNITETDLNSVFYYNILLSLAFCLLMIFSSGMIANFYNQEILEKTIKVTAWTLPISAISAVQLSILNRQLKQYLITVSTLVSLVAGGAVAIGLALRGMGVWALVWQEFVSALCFTLTISIFVRWRPSLSFSFKSLASLFKFGSAILLTDLIVTAANNISNMVIGKCYKPDILGFYTRSKSFAVLWPTSVKASIGRVLFPAFSKIQDDLPRLRSAFRRSLRLSVFTVTFPTLLFTVLCKPFIILILGSKWLPCVPYWWLIAFVTLFFPMEELNIQVLKSRGKSNLYLFIEVIKKAFFAAQIAVLIVYGIYSMLWLEILLSCFFFFLNSYFNSRGLSYGAIAQLYDSLPYFFLSALSCFSAWCFYKLITPLSAWLGLILPAAAGFAIYLLLNRLFKTSALLELVDIVAGKFPLIKRVMKL